MLVLTTFFNKALILLVGLSEAYPGSDQYLHIIERNFVQATEGWSIHEIKNILNGNNSVEKKKARGFALARISILTSIAQISVFQSGFVFNISIC